MASKARGMLLLLAMAGAQGMRTSTKSLPAWTGLAPSSILLKRASSSSSSLKASPGLRILPCPVPRNKILAAGGVRMKSSPSGMEEGGKFDAQRFYVRPDKLKDVMTAAFASVMRFGSGAFASGYSVGIKKDEPSSYSVLRFGGFMLTEESNAKNFHRPALPLQIYEFESCPFCRKVREAVAILDLDVEFLPCPKGGSVYRAQVQEMGGKQQFPYLVDPNTGTKMYESDDIVDYLFHNYGDGLVPWTLRGPLATVTAGLGLLPSNMLRPGGYKQAKKAEKSLIVWGYEASPFSKIVREVLSELELPHVWRSVARGSSKRQTFLDEMRGALPNETFQVPYLEDPNTGVKMFESAEIIEYLRKTYQEA